MLPFHRFTRIDFDHFKAFQKYTLHLRSFNILVGPNNAGKSTVLAAFRILAAAVRKAQIRKAEVVQGPKGEIRGYQIDMSPLEVAHENIFYNYDESHPASVRFHLTNGHSLLLYFPPDSKHCSLICNSERRHDTPSHFKTQFNCPIGFVPILGPVEQLEFLYKEETATRSLYNYQAARHFRNIWYHLPDGFDEFRRTLQKTWPGMDIQPPEIELYNGKPRLVMLCPEERMPREICWAGFGFQVWCQMLTHLIKSRDKVVFMIDEPDIYLHSDLQRQLIDILRGLGPDIVLATHSTEILTEADPDEIVLINKRFKSAKRLKSPSDLGEVFQILGSNLNPILTQLARTRRVIFVEGKDFRVLSKFAQRMGYTAVGSRQGFAVIPIDGFNPQKARSNRSPRHDQGRGRGGVAVGGEGVV